MGYYVRVLSTSSECVPFDELKRALIDNSLKADIRCEEEDESGWNQLLLIHKDGREIAVIERNPVFDGSLGEEEIEEFLNNPSITLDGKRYYQTQYSPYDTKDIELLSDLDCIDVYDDNTSF